MLFPLQIVADEGDIATVVLQTIVNCVFGILAKAPQFTQLDGKLASL